jgi:hypothetical protein
MSKPFTLSFILFCLSLFSVSMAAPPKTMIWKFPLPRTHTGVLMGNGTQGLMIWGGGNQLNITVGRAGFWDHRGGNDFSARTTFRQVKTLLEAKDEAGLRKVFEVPQKSTGLPREPQQIGGGRLEVYLPEGWIIDRGELQLNNAILRILVKNPSGKEEAIVIRQAMLQELAWVELPASLQDKVRLELVPTWKFVGEQLTKVGVEPPKSFKPSANGMESAGYCQYLPEDDPLALCYARNKNRITIATALNKNAIEEATGLVMKANIENTRKNTDAWWNQYWTDVPAIHIPDPVLQEIVDYGLYKQASTHPPQGVPAALQGPFNEEYQLPPWSNDYHFNINVQMIYWPVLATNRLEHLNPLWKMIKGWWPQLSANGSQFFGNPSAIMLPHAVDDRCHVVGTFWTGTIDHACTAWMAQMAWLHYSYSGDKTVLSEVAWPLLNGAFEGYWAMLEEVEDGKGGKRLSLPVSVSPEFKGSRMDAWGRDASFQLAALHMLARILPKAAQALNKTTDNRWQQVSDKLPPYTLIEGARTLENPESKTQRIALWEGMDLIESHRHHSHLASIYPFATINPNDPKHSTIVNNSLFHWTKTGPGLWSGWCVPWAATLKARCGQAEAAVGWLHWWNNTFTNQGRGTLHNAVYPGASIIASPNWSKLPAGTPNREIMQLDAGFGALTAVLELLVQNREDGIYVLPEVLEEWEGLTFSNIRTEGAFQVSAGVKNGKTSEIRIKSLIGGPLRLVHGLGDNYTLSGSPASGAMLQRECKAGEELVLKRTGK